MTWLSFIAEVIKAIAWPLALIIVFFGLRRHIVDLFPFLERAQWRGLDLQFSKRVKEVVAEAAIALPPVSISDNGFSAIIGAQTRQEQLTLLAALSPRAAIVEAWLGVENAAARAMVRLGLGGGGVNIHSQRKLRTLFATKQLLNDQQGRVFEELRDLRNRAAHISDLRLSESVVRDYIRAALQLEGLLDEQTKPPKKQDAKS